MNPQPALTCPEVGNQSTPPQELKGPIPQHLAVIMDGNGRWATQRGLPRIAGHRQGVVALKELLRNCQKWGIPTLTAYAFSTENWRRSLHEVGGLLVLFEQLLRSELAELNREGIRLTFLGDRTALPNPLRKAMDEAMMATQHNRSLQFNVALNYGGRQEIVQACQRLARLVQQGELSPETISEEWFEQMLYTAGLPSPDLLIRTSGEKRLSNFLLWQLAYTEFYFTPSLWPDFNARSLEEALQVFQQRDRRFGQIPEPSKNSSIARSCRRQEVWDKDPNP